MMALPGIVVRGERERDLDIALAEELASSPDFRAWFLDEIGRRSSFQPPLHDRADAARSGSGPGELGQMDIRLALVASSGEECGVVFIENKVRAEFQPDQPEKYAANVGVVAVRLSRACTAAVVVAPSDRTTMLDHRCFDAHFTIESIAGWLEARATALEAEQQGALSREIALRCRTRATLLYRLAGRQPTRSKPSLPHQPRVRFESLYRQIAADTVPDLAIRNAMQTAGAYDALFEFRNGLHKQAGVKRLRHGFSAVRQQVALELESDGRLATQLRAGLAPPLGFRAEATKTGTPMLRRDLDRNAMLDPDAAPESQEAAMARALAVIAELAEWVSTTMLLEVPKGAGQHRI